MAKPFEQVIAYTYSRVELMEQALTHRSAGARHNERLEFLGDSILNFVIAQKLFELFPDVDEGQLSRMRAKLVRKQALATVAIEIKLGDYLKLGSGELKSGGFRRESIIADALEAVIGSVLLDGGFEAARDLILRLFDSMIVAVTPEEELKDPKSRLQEYLQANKQPLPEYEVVSINGPPHDQAFVVSCHVEGLNTTFTGEGRSRRKAEQAAATQALAVFESKQS